MLQTTQAIHQAAIFCADHEAEIADLRAHAFELHGCGDAAGAESKLRLGLKLVDEHPELLGDLAALMYSRQRYIEAENLARRSLAADPGGSTCGPSAYWLAASVAASHRDVEAIELLTELTLGERGAVFAGAHPELAAMALTDLEGLRLRARPVALPTIASTRWTGRGAAKYELGHLNQAANQEVGGPIQDDEALLLYALVRVMRLRRVLEVGGLNGYSARNFLAALGDDPGAAVYTVDINPVPSQAANHHVITKDCAELSGRDVHCLPLDLVFFDAHVFGPQMALVDRLEQRGIVHPGTVIALHDTNLHPVKRPDWAYPVVESDGTRGYVHQPVERQMVNALHERGWDAMCFHVEPARCDDRLPVRHGITLMRRFGTLTV